MKYIVELENQGTLFWLKGTTWSFSVERGNKFDTREEAVAALENAARFMKERLVKTARIIAVGESFELPGRS